MTARTQVLVPVVFEGGMARPHVWTAVQRTTFPPAGLSHHSFCPESSRTDSGLGQTPCQQDGSISRSHVAKAKVCNGTDARENAIFAVAYQSHPTFLTPLLSLHSPVNPTTFSLLPHPPLIPYTISAALLGLPPMGEQLAWQPSHGLVGAKSHPLPQKACQEQQGIAESAVLAFLFPLRHPEAP